MSARRSRLVLLGLGHGHMQLLRDWATHKRTGVELTLVSPDEHFLYSACLSDWVSGRRDFAQDRVPVAPWLRASGAQWVRDRCIALDVNARTLRLRDDPERTLRFDWLSINTGASMGLDQLEQQIPGARGRVLPLRPLAQFMAYWEQALATARQRAMSVAVIGAGLGGAELALAVQQRLRQVKARASVTLLGEPDWAPLAQRAQAQLRRALQRSGVQCLAQRCTQVRDGELLLDNGMRLQCDLPMVATGPQAPAWLAHSGLQLDAHGFVAVNAHQQSTSHARVFALGDVATRIDAALPKSAQSAWAAGAQHADTLWAAIQGLDTHNRAAREARVHWLSTSDGRAIVTGRAWALSGAWVARRKHHRDQAVLHALREPA